MTLEQASCNIGRRVIYTPFKDCNSKFLEYGTITSVNSKNVFVLYDGDINSKSTTPSDIELEIK